MLPWKHGQNLESAKNTQEALELSKINYEVQKEPLVLNGIRFDRHFYTYRTDNNQPLGIVKNTYQVTQNQKAFEFIDSILDSIKYTYGGFFGQGEVAWLSAKLIGSSCVVNGDEHEFHTMFMTSHNGQFNITAIPIASYKDRVFAMQGVKIRHSRKANQQLELAVRTLKEIIGIFDHYGEKLNQLAATPFSKRQMKEYAESVLRNVFTLDEKEDYHITQNDLELAKQDRLPLKKRRYMEAVYELVMGQTEENKYSAFLSVLAHCNLAQAYRGDKKNENRLTSLVHGKMAKVQQIALSTLMGA